LFFSKLYSFNKMNDKVNIKVKTQMEGVVYFSDLVTRKIPLYIRKSCSRETPKQKLHCQNTLHIVEHGSRRAWRPALLLPPPPGRGHQEREQDHGGTDHHAQREPAVSPSPLPSATPASPPPTTASLSRVLAVVVAV
jgi:hypothetical protein